MISFFKITNQPVVRNLALFQIIVSKVEGQYIGKLNDMIFGGKQSRQVDRYPDIEKVFERREIKNTENTDACRSLDKHLGESTRKATVAKSMTSSDISPSVSPWSSTEDLSYVRKMKDLRVKYDGKRAPTLTYSFRFAK